MSSLGAHAGGDEVIMREFLRCIKDPVLPPLAGVREGIESAFVALAIDQSARTGSIVDLRETWQRAG